MSAPVGSIRWQLGLAAATGLGLVMGTIGAVVVAIFNPRDAWKAIQCLRRGQGAEPLYQDSPEDIADHMALVEETLRDVPSPPPGSVDPQAFVEWVWVPGKGYVKEEKRDHVSS